MADIDRIERLKRDIERLREESRLDDRASSASRNPDAAPVFASWAAAKRQRADDIESLLDELSRRSEVIERAKEALAPFAEACRHFDGYVKDDDVVSLALQHIKARHLRAARALTAAEDVLAWLIIEKIGVPDDVSYSPHQAQKIIENALNQATASEAEATDLRRKLEEHRKALEPFAAAKDHFDGHVRDDDTVDIALRHIRARHVRAAASALTTDGGPNG